MTSRGRGHLRHAGSTHPSLDRRVRADPRGPLREFGDPRRTDRVITLQQLAGNSAVSTLLARRTSAGAADAIDSRHGQSRARPVIMRQDSETEEDGQTFGEMLAEGLEQAWRTKSFARSRVQHLADEVVEFVNSRSEHTAFYETGFRLLDDTAALLQAVDASAGDQTSENQLDRAAALLERWSRLKQRVIATNRAAARREMRRVKASMEALRENVLFAYRDVYAAGKEPSDIEVGAGTLKDVAGRTLTVLSTINAVDALLDGRDVAPLVQVLSKVKSVVDLLAGWRTVPALAASSQDALAQIENTWAVGATVVGFTAAGSYMFMYAHIGPLLAGISRQWDRVVTGLRAQNRQWWELREVVGDDLPYASEEPGGRPVFNYMKTMFETSEPPSGSPPDAVLGFFDDRREMFTRTAREVMDQRGPGTQSVFLGLGTEIDPDRLNSWVFHHRAMVWKLIYGRDMRPPQPG